MLLSELLAVRPRLWTVAEYAAIGETEPGYTELLSGRLLISPGPTPGHQIALAELARQLSPQLPPGLELICDVDVDLELVASNEPGFSRRPDLVVVDRNALERVDAEASLLRASEVQVVVEIVTPDSRRIDEIDKRGEYGEAGIPWYWIIDITEPISLIACRNGVDHQRVTDSFTTEEPFAVTIDLGRLR